MRICIFFLQKCGVWDWLLKRRDKPKVIWLLVPTAARAHIQSLGPSIQVASCCFLKPMWDQLSPAMLLFAETHYSPFWSGQQSPPLPGRENHADGGNPPSSEFPTRWVSKLQNPGVRTGAEVGVRGEKAQPGNCIGNLRTSQEQGLYTRGVFPSKA